MFRGKKIQLARELPQISAEYGSICAKAGETQFKIFALKKSLDEHNKKLKDLEAEFNLAKEKAEQKKAAAQQA